MSALRPQIRSEWRKWRTIRSSWVLVVAALTADLVLKTISVLLVDRTRGTLAEVVFALRPSIFYPVLLCVLGVLIAAGEWRYRTAGPTYCVQPRRGIVLAAKVVLAAMLGLAVGTVGTATSDLVALLVARQRSLPVPEITTTLAVAAGSAVGGAVLAVLGVALGSWLTSQVASLATAAGLFLAVGPVALLVDRRLYALLPGGLLDSIAGQRVANPDLLPVAVAAVGLAAYGAVVGGTAVRAVRRRAVT